VPHELDAAILFQSKQDNVTKQRRIPIILLVAHLERSITRNNEVILSSYGNGSSNFINGEADTAGCGTIERAAS